MWYSTTTHNGTYTGHLLIILFINNHEENVILGLLLTCWQWYKEEEDWWLFKECRKPSTVCTCVIGTIYTISWFTCILRVHNIPSKLHCTFLLLSLDLSKTLKCDTQLAVWHPKHRTYYLLPLPYILKLCYMYMFIPLIHCTW